MAGGTKDERPGADRLLALLDVFDRSDRTRFTLSELAERAGLPVATAHRLVARLLAWGALERTPDGRGYQLGRKLWSLGMRYPAARTLREAALPFLEDLVVLTKQNAVVAVRDGLETLYLERLTARDAVRLVAEVGERLPLHATGVGLVLLAFGDPSLLDGVIEARPRRLQPATMTTEAELRPRLARIRREGIAVTRDEMTAGAASVAAPIRDARGDVVAAVSIVVPSGVPLNPRAEIAVRLAAAGITRNLARHADHRAFH